MAKKCSIDYGGQALIEGVLMKSKTHYSMAVRRPDKKISVKIKKLKWKKKGYLAWPFVRGVVTLIEMLTIGMKALTYSANESIGEEEEKLTNWQITLTVGLSLVLAIVLFVLLPFLITKFLITGRGIVFDLVDGLIRVIVFVAYILVISLMKDVKTLFQYHGAEHMTVHCYEAGNALTVKNVKKYSTAHPRCGTTFILMFLVISILIFTLVRTDALWIRFVSRIVLLPVIAGISFELLKLSGKNQHNLLFRAISWPGLMLQRLTTRKPTGKQIEVAIKALKALINKA